MKKEDRSLASVDDFHCASSSLTKLVQLEHAV